MIFVPFSSEEKTRLRLACIKLYPQLFSQHSSLQHRDLSEKIPLEVYRAIDDFRKLEDRYVDFKEIQDILGFTDDLPYQATTKDFILKTLLLNKRTTRKDQLFQVPEEYENDRHIFYAYYVSRDYTQQKLPRLTDKSLAKELIPLSQGWIYTHMIFHDDTLALAAFAANSALYRHLPEHLKLQKCIAIDALNRRREHDPNLLLLINSTMYEDMDETLQADEEVQQAAQ